MVLFSSFTQYDGIEDPPPSCDATAINKEPYLHVLTAARRSGPAPPGLSSTWAVSAFVKFVRRNLSFISVLLSVASSLVPIGSRSGILTGGGQGTAHFWGVIRSRIYGQWLRPPSLITEFTLKLQRHFYDPITPCSALPAAGVGSGFKVAWRVPPESWWELWW